MSDPMTREALLLKAREWLAKNEWPNEPHTNWLDPHADVYDEEILADFCLSELAAKEGEIKKLRKELREK